MVKKTLLGADEELGVAGMGESSKATVNVEVVPSSLVCPEPEGVLIL